MASKPLEPADAAAALRAEVPDLDRLIARGQIEILGHAEWYMRQEALSVEDVPKAWLARVAGALAEGYRGLRVTGNVAFLEASGWRDFMHYEATVHECFKGQRIVALCSYPLSACGPDQILDIVERHGFAIARRQGQWRVIESASLKSAKQELARLNRELENRVQARTAELQQALEREKLLAREFHHRLQNKLMLAQAIIGLAGRHAESVDQFREEISRRFQALARTNTALLQNREDGVLVADIVNGELEPYRAANARRLALDGPSVRLPSRAVVPFAMAIHELTTNAVKHGALAQADGHVSVRWETIREAGGPQLLLEWIERGGSVPHQPQRRGFGSVLLKRIVAIWPAAQLDTDYGDGGLRVRFRIPLAGETGA